jgi:uncharacterized membrane protein (Fun14 family)
VLDYAGVLLCGFVIGYAYQQEFVLIVLDGIWVLSVFDLADSCVGTLIPFQLYNHGWFVWVVYPG